MRYELCVALVVAFFCAAADSKFSPAKVKMYSSKPGEYGVDNTLICHVSEFHPPDITITLLKNGREMADAKQSDLAFVNDWRFHLTKTVAFKPTSEDKYTCRVTHHTSATKEYAWDSNM